MRLLSTPVVDRPDESVHRSEGSDEDSEHGTRRAHRRGRIRVQDLHDRLTRDSAWISRSTGSTSPAMKSGASTGTFIRDRTSLYIKLYEGETNTRVLILLDISGSMNYGSGRDQEDRLRANPRRLPDATLPIISATASACSLSIRRFGLTFRRAAGAVSCSNILS